VITRRPTSEALARPNAHTLKGPTRARDTQHELIYHISTTYYCARYYDTFTILIHLPIYRIAARTNRDKQYLLS
jgi:hypothetical protein